ncbi:acetyltransferase (GNAT) domain protein [Lachnoanaerobaculum sp. MSX33]|uniref:GNAT family N-acetyltransferase n=1 Tax=Lachnoanaerobaculum sp. MSX33 TaxID=936596 RepID=UPI0003DF8D12|nr:GNAT family N-acetyltransferase [Lachnoanaerobaculum sp. MSX33]ETO98823.1 acetyltransferase (GNAT) domain protein [Lachnoanaerobaculum sp. MSX33]
MKTSCMSIRLARPEDAKNLLEIYAYYVKETAISFETEVPSVEEFKFRIEEILKKYPYIVACYDDEILGYAYLHPFVGRKAYELSAETTIYLNPDKKKMGIGKKLYSVLEDIAKAQNITNLYSCIGYVDKEDEYLNNNSAEFHEHMGYRMVGKFENCGHKFDRWYHMIWMEKIIGEHGEIKEFLRFEETNYIL